MRHVIARGTVVHPDVVDSSLKVTGFVLPDGDEALFSIATDAVLEDSLPEFIRFPGLEPERLYGVALAVDVSATREGLAPPWWMATDGITTTEAAFGGVGVQLPALWPVQALVVGVLALSKDLDV